MNTIPVQYKIEDDRVGVAIPLPRYVDVGEPAGLDLRACVPAQTVLKPNESMLISTGIAVWINNPNYTLLLLPRSGLGHKRGIVLGNLVGLVDADYQGTLYVSIWNRSNEDFTITPGDRIAQAVCVPVVRMALEKVDEFNTKTVRGKGGFGSTGLNGLLNILS